MEGKDISLTEQGELIWIERLRVASIVLTVCLSEPLRALHLNETLVGRDVFKRRRIKQPHSVLTSSYCSNAGIQFGYEQFAWMICFLFVFFQMVQPFVS